MTLLSTLVAETRSLSLEEFLAAWPMPVLLHRVEEDDEEDRAFKTGITDPRANRLEVAAGLTNHADLEVLKIEKRPGGPFKDRISVGRSRNNDIHLDYPKISKFHAFFTWSEDQSKLHLTDADSTNGTFVNSHQIKSGQPVVLPDRALISFGRYHFRFHMPTGLYQVVREIALG